MAEQLVLGPSSECHKVFLQCKSDFIIFGGGELCASTLKTIP